MLPFSQTYLPPPVLAQLAEDPSHDLVAAGRCGASRSITHYSTLVDYLVLGARRTPAEVPWTSASSER